MTKATLWILVLAYVIITAVAFVVNNKVGSALTEIKPGKPDTVVTRIFVHDTIRDTVPHDSIQLAVGVIRWHDTSTNAGVAPHKGPLGRDVGVLADTTICYEVRRVEKDSACIDVAVCSDSLPKRKPMDLSFNIKYLPPPKMQTTIFRTDTLLKFKPVYQNWQLYAVAAVAFALGMYAMHK